MEKEQFTFDVIVHENHIVEVARGSVVTVAQAYGEDWSSAPCVQFHVTKGALVEQPAKKSAWRTAVLAVLPSLIVLALGMAAILIWR